MKIILNASIKEHREIAELFRNQLCEFKRSISSKSMGGAFVSVMDSPHYPKFVVYRLGDVTTKESVTIDLDTAKMDLRMAIGTSIEFEIDCGDDEFFSESMRKINALDNQIFEYSFGEIEEISELDIKICPDYLKSVGVEVED